MDIRRPCIGIRYPPRHSLLYFRACEPEIILPPSSFLFELNSPYSTRPSVYTYTYKIVHTTYPSCSSGPQSPVCPDRLAHTSSDPLVKQQIRTPVPTTDRTHEPATPRLFLTHDHLFSRYSRYRLVVKVQPPAGTLHSNGIVPTAGSGAVVVYHTQQAISDRLSGALGG